MSSDRIDLILNMSKFALNLNGFLPVEGRCDMLIIVGILIILWLTGLAAEE